MLPYTEYDLDESELYEDEDEDEDEDEAYSDYWDSYEDCRQ